MITVPGEEPLLVNVQAGIEFEVPEAGAPETPAEEEVVQLYVVPVMVELR